MRLFASVVCGACLLSATAQTPPAATTVDVELVLAADVSQSMDYDEQKLQRNGYVEAFRQADVIAAMLAGKTHRIAVAYVEFAGDQPPETAIPWTVIDNEAAARHFADQLLALPINGEPKTSEASGRCNRASGLQLPQVVSPGRHDIGRWRERCGSAGRRRTRRRGKTWRHDCWPTDHAEQTAPIL